MKLIDDYFKIQREIYAYFGYAENWAVIPLDDSRQMFWRLDGEGPGTVWFAESEKALTNSDAVCSDEVYTQRFLPKWVYRGPEYTMVCVDTGVDGNRFLRVFDNAKERTLVQLEKQGC